MQLPVLSQSWRCGRDRKREGRGKWLKMSRCLFKGEPAENVVCYKGTGKKLGANLSLPLAHGNILIVRYDYYYLLLFS